MLSTRTGIFLAALLALAACGDDDGPAGTATGGGNAGCTATWDGTFAGSRVCTASLAVNRDGRWELSLSTPFTSASTYYPHMAAGIDFAAEPVAGTTYTSSPNVMIQVNRADYVGWYVIGGLMSEWGVADQGSFTLVLSTVGAAPHGTLDATLPGAPQSNSGPGTAGTVTLHATF
jgi:hypothetical protein